MPSEACVRCAQRVPWVTFVGNLSLGIFKLVLALVGNSKALLADAMHSLCDVIGTIITLFSRRLSGRPADHSHHYGHGKVEFIGSVFIYSVLVVISVGLVWGGLGSVLEGRHSVPEPITILAAVVSVGANYVMFRLCECAGNKNNSPAILADGFENRADAMSSIAVIFGIGAAILIHPIFDPLAAMIVGVVIFENCVKELRKVVSGLMDEGLPADVLLRIEQVAMAHRGVTGVAFVKSRRTGPNYCIDLGIRVPGSLAVGEADAIIAELRAELHRRSEQLHLVQVFVVPDAVGNEPEPSGEPFAPQRELI